MIRRRPLALALLTFQAGLRAVHDLGPEIRRAISGELDEDSLAKSLAQDEPMHRVIQFSFHFLQQFVLSLKLTCGQPCSLRVANLSEDGREGLRLCRVEVFVFEKSN